MTSVTTSSLCKVVALSSLPLFLTIPLPNAARPTRLGRAVGAAWGPLPTSGWTPSPFAAAHSEPDRLGPVAVPNACAVRSGVFGLLNVGQESGNRGLRPGGDMAGSMAGDLTRTTANEPAAVGLSCQRLTSVFATHCVPTVFADRWGHTTAIQVLAFSRQRSVVFLSGHQGLR